jgi:formylglycine-generating enzyme required for sulfatase activity
MVKRTAFLSLLALVVLTVSGCASGGLAALTAEPTPSAGEARLRSADGTTMLFVPGGAFEMGSTECPNERPVHAVTVDSLWIDRTEVSNAQYRQCVEAGVCDEPNCWYDDDFSAPQQPVVCVSWYQAGTYCDWVGARLPTEAEWEYAARGSEGYRYPWGDEFDGTRLNFCDGSCDRAYADETIDNGYAHTAPVDSFPEGASWCGAVNMVGNAWEWTADWFGDYSREVQVNPTGPESGTQRVLRGGAWDSMPFEGRGAVRKGSRPAFQFLYLGFRCASSSPP